MKCIFDLMVLGMIFVSCAQNPKMYNEGNKYYASVGKEGSSSAKSQETSEQRSHTEEMFNMAVDSRHSVAFNEGDEFYGFTPDEIIQIERARKDSKYLNNLAFANMIGEQKGNVGPRSNVQANNYPPYNPERGGYSGGDAPGRGSQGSGTRTVPYQGLPAPPPVP